MFHVKHPVINILIKYIKNLYNKYSTIKNTTNKTCQLND